MAPLRQKIEVETLGRDYFAHKNTLMTLLAAHSDQQQKNIELWQSLQKSPHSRGAPKRYFPPCVAEATEWIRTENLDDLQDPLRDFAMERPGAFERVRDTYQAKIDAMQDPIRKLQAAVADARSERDTLVKLQSAMTQMENLHKRWTK